MFNRFDLVFLLLNSRSNTSQNSELSIIAHYIN